MGSQRGSGGATPSQVKGGEKVFKQQAQKARAKLKTSGVGTGGSGGRLSVGGRGGRGSGGGGGGGGGIGGAGGGGGGTPKPGPGDPKPRPHPSTGPPGGPLSKSCEHSTCKCQVSESERYCKKYCADAAARGSSERCRCNHDACT